MNLFWSEICKVEIEEALCADRPHTLFLVLHIIFYKLGPIYKRECVKEISL